MTVKKVLISLGHPAHFHLFKNVITRLNDLGIETAVIIRKKDILENLLKITEIPYYNILKNDKKPGFLGLIWSIILRDIRLIRFCLKYKPDLLIGSTVEITHTGKILNIPSIAVGEDDIHIVPLFKRFAAPLADCIVVPTICKLGRFESKAVKYPGYQELAYLHPNHFTPQLNIVKKYVDTEKPYFIIRFSKLSAHHDKGITGINSQIAEKLIASLKPYGNIYLTSERELEPQFEQYRIFINPIDIHHVMAYAQLFIGDSQTMAAEAGILGVPFIRFNDFVGRISYLEELENQYKLGYGIKSENQERLFTLVPELIQMPDREKTFMENRLKLLEDKIDTEKFYTWFIRNFPQSKQLLKEENFSFDQFK